MTGVPDGGGRSGAMTGVLDGIDVAAVSAWIASLGIGFQPPMRLERIGLGRSNLTFSVTDVRGCRWVLRRPPLGTLLNSAHDVVREARILSALRGTSVPAPKIFGVCTDTGVSDVPLVLLEFVDGVVVDRTSTASALPPSVRHATGLSLARTLARIHAVDLTSTGLIDLASHKAYAARQVKRWAAQWAQSKTTERPQLDELTERLRAAAPEQHELTLVHGDFHLRNVITSPTTAEVVAVLDWELSTLGDPLADLGTLLAYWPRPSDPMAEELSPSIVDGFPSREELVREYAEATGRDVTDVAFWHVLGLWKVAIIAEGVLRRAGQDPRNRVGPAGGPAEPQIDALVAAASDIAASAGI